MADWLTQLSHRIDDHVADAQADAQLSALVDGRGHPAQPLPARAHPGRSTFHDEVESGREVAPDGRGPSPFAPAAVRPLFGVSDDKIAAVSKAATPIQAAERGRAVRPDVKLGICGEHGGDPSSIAFCEKAGLDYVSCSPYRVPIARLAAAQAALNVEREKDR